MDFTFSYSFRYCVAMEISSSLNTSAAIYSGIALCASSGRENVVSPGVLSSMFSG